MDGDIQKMIAAAHAGGAVLKKYFGQSLDIVQKSSAFDLKTRADEESEAAIVEMLKRDFPEANIHAEEGGKFENGSDYTFIIDPLDGTHNFLLGIPTFTVSIGLVHKGKIVAGVIYAPTVDQTFYAEHGKGAFLEGQRLRANTETDIKQAVIMITFWYDFKPERVSQVVSRAWNKHVRRLINDWCPTYYSCLLASGKIDGLTCDGIELHDFVAAKLIAKEAGCLVYGYDGKPETDDLQREFIIASNPGLVKDLLDIARRS